MNGEVIGTGFVSGSLFYITSNYPFCITAFTIKVSDEEQATETKK